MGPEINSRIRRERSPPTHAQDPEVCRITAVLLNENNYSSVREKMREYKLSRDNITIFWTGYVYMQGWHTLTGQIELKI